VNKVVKIFEFLVSVLITFGFIYLFYKVIGFEKFVKFFSSISLFNILFAFFLYFTSYILRTIRWRITLPVKNFFKLFKLTVYNTVFNIFLPFRTGEFSFFYILKKEGIEISKSAVSFFTVRIFDAYALLVLFIFSFLLIKSFILAILFLFFSPIGIFFIAFASNFIKYEKFKSFKEDVLHKKNIFSLYVLSILTLFFKFTAFYLVLPQGLNLSYSLALFASSAGDLTTILPIHGIAGIGTYEGGFAGILLLLGINKDTAILSSIFVHIFILSASAVLALITKLLSYILKA